jgi:hypothetical protein
MFHPLPGSLPTPLIAVLTALERNIVHVGMIAPIQIRYSMSTQF